ncbi:glycosyltransferase [Planococcus sp. 1R117A]|uniref:glycosyltransferase n=1 Tax=Planococcus sp. 1R117A TaxID=3447020 RepID=UPI003EDC1C23
MKILHMISGGETGGSKKHLLQLFHESPVEMELLLLTEGPFAEEARKQGVTVTVIPQKNRFDQSTSRKILAFIQQNGFTLVHSHGAKSNFLINSIRRKMKIPWFITVHSDPSLDFLHQPKAVNQFFTFLNKRALRNADHLFAVSEKFKTMLVEMGMKASKITPVFNGIEFHETIPAYDKKQIRAQFDTAETDFVFAIVARLHPVKGHEVLLKAFSKLENNKWKLWIIGDGALRKTLEARAKELEIQEKVQFLGTRNDVDQLLYAADVSLLTSYSESFPLVLLESADMGTPVIATDVGGVSALVDHGKTGWIIVPGDEESLLQAAKAAISSDTSTMGRQLREFAVNNFSNANLQKKLLSTYRDLQKKN